MQPQAPWSYLTASHPEAALGYQGMAMAAFPSMFLGQAADMPNYNYEVQGLALYGGNYSGSSGAAAQPILDCSPADVVEGPADEPAARRGQLRRRGRVSTPAG